MPKPLSVAEADAVLRDAIASHQTWDRARWRKLEQQLQRFPADVSRKLFDKILGLLNFMSLAELPEAFDEAVLAFIVAKQRVTDDCAFIAAAMQAVQGDRHAALVDLIGCSIRLGWASRTSRPHLAKILKRHPEYVVGAQAAIGQFGVETTSRYLPILVVDGSADSFDLLIPFLEQARSKRGPELDWFRREVVPLCSDTPAARAVIAMLSAAATERTHASPALAFAKQLGMKTVPTVLQATVVFRDRNKAAVYRVRFDSTQAAWCETRPGSWSWAPLEPAKIVLPAESVTFLLRVQSNGTDRAKLATWATSLLPTAGRTAPSKASRR